MVRYSLKKILGLIEEAAEKTSGTFRIALSGGQTPAPLYSLWSKSKKFPFERTEFFIVDERFVPLTHPASNYKMINKHLFSKIRKKIKAIHYFDTSLPEKKVLPQYSRNLKDIKLDLTILGIGNDGHFGSIFPRSKAITSKKLVTYTQTSKFHIKDRLTMTANTILESKKIFVLLKNKPSVIEELKNPIKSPQEFPAHLLKKHPGLSLFDLY